MNPRRVVKEEVKNFFYLTSDTSRITGPSSLGSPYSLNRIVVLSVTLVFSTDNSHYL